MKNVLDLDVKDLALMSMEKIEQAFKLDLKEYIILNAQLSVLQGNNDPDTCRKRQQHR